MTVMAVDEKKMEPQSIAERNEQLAGYIRDLDLERMSAEELLCWASETFPGRAVLNTSFQYTGTAMIHMAVGLDLRFATLDTLRLHPETYVFINEVQTRYGCEIEVIRPKSGDVQRMVDVPAMAPAPDAVMFSGYSRAYGELSSYFSVSIIDDSGVRWPSVEHYYQAQKFPQQCDQDEIRAAPSPIFWT